MAFTVTKLFQYNEGNKVFIAYDVTADANSGVIVTGLNVVEAIMVSVQSAATGSQNFKRNKNAAGAATNGSIMASSCTNGDLFHVIAIGH